MNTLYTGITCPNPAYVHTPLIEIAPVDDDAALQRVAHDIDRYDYVLFTSRYAAKYVGAMFAHARRIVYGSCHACFWRNSSSTGDFCR